MVTIPTRAIPHINPTQNRKLDLLVAASTKNEKERLFLEECALRMTERDAVEVFFAGIFFSLKKQYRFYSSWQLIFVSLNQFYISIIAQFKKIINMLPT
jgi:hypothetical protein